MNGGSNHCQKRCAGRPVIWAIVRHETSAVFTRILSDLKAACEAIMPGGAEFRPSCTLVDNSDAEINAARYASATAACTLVYYIRSRRFLEK